MRDRTSVGRRTRVDRQTKWSGLSYAVSSSLCGACELKQAFVIIAPSIDVQ